MRDTVARVCVVILAAACAHLAGQEIGHIMHGGTDLTPASDAVYILEEQ